MATGNLDENFALTGQPAAVLVKPTARARPRPGDRTHVLAFVPVEGLPWPDSVQSASATVIFDLWLEALNCGECSNVTSRKIEANGLQLTLVFETRRTPDVLMLRRMGESGKLHSIHLANKVRVYWDESISLADARRWLEELEKSRIAHEARASEDGLAARRQEEEYRSLSLLELLEKAGVSADSIINDLSPSEIGNLDCAVTLIGPCAFVKLARARDPKVVAAMPCRDLLQAAKESKNTNT